MSKVNPRKLESKSKKKYLDLLWSSISNLETKDEVEKFFRDLLSESEAIMLARRIEIAKCLLKGESYNSIAEKLEVGKDTIGRVQGWLVSGSGGYEKVIGSFDRQFKKQLKISRYDDKPELYSFGWLKEKYPLHFFLFNLIDKNKGFKKTKK